MLENKETTRFRMKLRGTQNSIVDLLLVRIKMSHRGGYCDELMSDCGGSHVAQLVEHGACNAKRLLKCQNDWNVCVPVFSSLSLELLPERAATLMVYEDLIHINSGSQGERESVYLVTVPGPVTSHTLIMKYVHPFKTSLMKDLRAHTHRQHVSSVPLSISKEQLH